MNVHVVIPLIGVHHTTTVNAHSSTTFHNGSTAAIALFVMIFIIVGMCACIGEKMVLALGTNEEECMAVIIIIAIVLQQEESKR